MKETMIGRCYFCDKILIVVEEEYKVRTGKKFDKIETRTSIKQNYKRMVEQSVFRKVCTECLAELKVIKQTEEFIQIL